MSNKKPRVLFIGEASFLNTGYAIYTHEILTRLYNTKKYNIAELGIYGHMNDHRKLEIPWTYYGNLPDTKEEEQIYLQYPLSQFGEWKFEDICLDFKPDIVCSITDPWMNEYQQRSPFKKLFNWIIMPTIDSIPQKEQWMDIYRDADGVFTYTEFGRDYLTQEGTDVIDLASPAADYDVLKPVSNKKQHRQDYGFQDNLFIIGTVMRNQKRKLYPDLIESFAKFLKKYPKLGKKTYLYIHTSYPDQGWDIPKLLRENNLGHKVLFTYICGRQSCRHVFPSFFQDAIQACTKCGHPTASLPNVQLGVTKEQMATIMNFFDIYVQYSICEGFGMPLVEAAACGVPVIAVNYSGMASVAKNINGYLVDVQRFFLESETHSKRIYPDNDHLVEIWNKFFTMPESLRLKKSRETYLATKKCYNWNKSAKAWENYIDNVKIRDHKETWDSPINITMPNFNIPEGLNNEQFAYWIIANIWGQKNKVNSYLALRLIRDLNYRQSIGGTGGQYFNEDSTLGSQQRYKEFSREHAKEEMVKLNQFWTYWEGRRIGTIQEPVRPFILNKKEGNEE